MVIRAAGTEKPEREEVVEPLVEPTPQRRRDREAEPVRVPEREKEKEPVGVP